jgi:hypothetical protein
MVKLAATAADQQLVIEIGGMPVLLRSESAEFLHMLEKRYSGFLNAEADPDFEIDIDLVPPGRITEQEDVAVRFVHGRWIIERGDLRAEWEQKSRRGRIVQSANPYSIDTTLRIFHSLILAQEGGLLVHAASAVRDGKAFLFAGVSGAGKTTLSRLAPPDTKLLTDEISYVRRSERCRGGNGYIAYGTPFAGELAEPGENTKAPLGGLYFLEKGSQNIVEQVKQGEAARRLLENVLFFAKDPELVGLVFEAACELVRNVPAYRLTFYPNRRVWELIG